MRTKIKIRLLSQGILPVLLVVILSACGGSIPNTGETGVPSVEPTLPIVSTLPAFPTIPVPLTTSLPAESTITTPTEAVALTQTQPTGAALNCTSPANPTKSLTEGPYFKANSPERASLIDPGMAGTKLVLTGYVLDTNCKPVSGALLDFWQADSQGEYDNTGFVLRGHQFTDASGRYHLETVVPGEYPGRTEHIHFKVQAPGGPLITSQLFFPAVAQNETDQIYDPSLLVNIQNRTDQEIQATYNFVVNVK